MKDGILPLPSGYKVPARHADCRQSGFLQRGIEILPHALFIRGRMPGIVHAAVDHGPDRFQKRSEEPRGNIADPVVRMKRQLCFFHAHILLERFLLFLSGHPAGIFHLRDGQPQFKGLRGLVYLLNFDTNLQAFSTLCSRHSCCCPLTPAKAVRQTPSSLS